MVVQKMFDKAPVDCLSMWTVHSYEGDYNPLHDHDVSYDQKCMAFSIILYCMVPPQIYEGRGSTKLHSNGGATDGCTYFCWGTNTGADHLVLKPKTDRYVVPEEGKFLIFPSWLNHSVAPFYGEGERRTLSANFRVPFGANAKDEKVEIYISKICLKEKNIMISTNIMEKNYDVNTYVESMHICFMWIYLQTLLIR